MGDILFADFETRCDVDLKKFGADVYARSPHAQVMAFGYSFNDSDVIVNKLHMPPPPEVLAHISSGGTMVAHNAAFEWLIWNYCWRREFPFIPPLKIEQMICTMSMAYAMGLPAALEKLAKAIDIKHQKDMEGSRITIKLSKPNDVLADGTIVWCEDWCFEKQFEKMYEYCAQDVKVEKEVYKRLCQLSPYEKDIWYLDHKINQRGIKIDVKAARVALEVVAYEKERLNKHINKLTEDKVRTTTSVKQLSDWLKTYGHEMGVTKNEVTQMLENKDLDLLIKEVLETRQEAAKSSTSKLQTMISSVCDDNRARSLFQYHGAGTGRWAGRRIQVQNLPRGKIEPRDIERVLGLLNGNSI